jgi:hypothetical protein
MLALRMRGGSLGMAQLGRATAATSMVLAAVLSACHAKRWPAALDDDARIDLVANIADQLRDDYVDPEAGKQAAWAIKWALANHRYDQITELSAFAQQLTTDMQKFTGDRRLSAASGSMRDPWEPSGEEPQSRALHTEGGVVRADRLADDIGYVEIASFPYQNLFAPSIDQAMALLADTRALIVDLRRNPGGQLDSVVYLESFFVDGATPVHVDDVLSRQRATETYATREYWTSPTPVSYLGKPVYVLTSAQTLSEAEGFAYGMRALKRATLVGETTGGAANTLPPIGSPISPGRKCPCDTPSTHMGLWLSLPNGRRRNPITGTNWEGVGVKPDVVSSAGDALAVAFAQLGHKPSSSDIDALSQARLFAPHTTPRPGAEAAVRRMTANLARGEPRTSYLRIFEALGPIKSVAFTGVGPAGVDTFNAKHVNGVVAWSIALAPDGKVIRSWIAPPKIMPRDGPQPGAQAAIRRLAGELARGEPNYGLLSESVARDLRDHLPLMQRMFASAGPVESVRLDGDLSSSGIDVYEVRLANGLVSWSIVLSQDGKVIYMSVLAEDGAPYDALKTNPRP